MLCADTPVRVTTVNANIRVDVSPSPRVLAARTSTSFRPSVSRARASTVHEYPNASPNRVADAVAVARSRARAQKAFPVRTRRKSGRLHAKLDDGRDGIRAEFHGGCGEEEGDDDYALDPIARGDAHAASPASECGNQKQTVGRKQLSSETRELGLEIAWYKN